MPIQVIDGGGPWEAATQGALRGFGIGASAYEDQQRLLQQQKATQIQQAIEQDRLKQQADALGRLNEYRQGELDIRQQEADARNGAVEEKAKQEAAKLQQAAETQANTRAYLARKYGDNSDAVSFFDATGQIHPSLPESQHYHAARGGSGDPKFQAIIGQHRRTKADVQAAQKDLAQYAYSGKGDQLPSKTVPGAIRGKEAEYTAAKKKSDEAAAAFEHYDGLLDQWYRGRLGPGSAGAPAAAPRPAQPAAPGGLPQSGTLNPLQKLSPTPALRPVTPVSPPPAQPQPASVPNPPTPAPATPPNSELQIAPKGDGTQPPPGDLARQVMDRLISSAPPGTTREQIKDAYRQNMQGMGYNPDLPPINAAPSGAQ